MTARLVALLIVLLAAPTAWGQVALKIRGIDGELLKNVEAFIGPESETGRMSYRALAEHAEAQARLGLQALGYYHPVISIRRKASGGDVQCLMHIKAGPPVRIERVELELADAALGGSLATYVDENSPKKGDVFHHGLYEAFKAGLLQHAQMAGYFRAAWREASATVDVDANSAVIRLVLDAGPRSRFGAITVGGKALDPELIARFPRFAAGDWYDAGKVAELHRDLLRTGWFGAVRIRAEPGDASDGTVPVNIDYDMRPRNRVGIGAGFSTDIGPRLQLQWEKPWLNEKGHSLTTYLELSQYRAQLEASYLIPLADPVNSQLALTYGLQYEDRNDYTAWLTTAGLEHRKRLPNRWRVIRSLELERETDDFATFSTHTTLLMPGITLTRVESEGTPLVTQGWRFSTKLQVANESLASDAELARLTAEGKGIYSLGKHLRLIGRVGAGALETPDLLSVPVSVRFFAGGDQSVRGYDYESLGPVNALGELVGGHYRLEGSLEGDVRIAEHWLLAAFADRGGAFDDLAGTDFFTGTGAGIRWLSPIGPLRLDFAWGISREDPPFNIHFYMGPEL